MKNSQKRRLEEIKMTIANGATFSNMNAQFVCRPTGEMFRYDLITGKYKAFTNVNKFVSAVAKFMNVGY